MDGIKTSWKIFVTSNPTSNQVVWAGLREGSGGGVYEGGQTIADANGNGMSRPMRTRVVLKYWHPTGGWLVCQDSQWINNGTREWSHNGRDNGATPPCGRATYGFKTAAIFWSYSLNKWLGGSWVLSGNLGLPPSCCIADNPPADTDSDPLGLPPPP